MNCQPSDDSKWHNVVLVLRLVDDTDLHAGEREYLT
jgi:hypothetical protein